MKRNSRSLAVQLLLVFIALMMSAAALPAFAQNPVASVNTGAANLRSGPGVAHGSIGTLPFGFGVNLTARNGMGDWVFVTLNNGVQGWLSTSVLFTAYPIANLPINDTAAASQLVPFATVTSGSVNMRQQPDPNSAVVTVLPQGQRVDLLGRNYNGSWAQVRLTNGQTGWVIAGGINASVPVRSLTPADGSVAAPIAPNVNTGNSGQSSGGTYYVVAAGDSLSRIAQRHGVSMYSLIVANNIANPNLIFAGQTIYIPR
ncbi:MAG: SH3 domain-containing protein [Anaerolineae bacterium]|nr:SH3 domain-containing protein [Anaerolineae bacterium]